MLKKLLFSCLLLAVGVWLVIDDLFSPLSPKARVVEIENFCGRVASELSDSAEVAFEVEYRYLYSKLHFHLNQCLGQK